MKKRSVCCCVCTTIIIIILLIAAAVTAFFLWARQPDINFNGVAPPVQPTESFKLNSATDFVFNLRLNFTVNNPNFVGASLPSIKASGTLPVNKDVVIANGELKDVGIEKQANTTLLFPIQINYQMKEDKDLKILKYIANNCGLTGQQRKQLTVDYNLNIVAKVVLVNIDLPTFSNTANFDCPIPAGTTIPGLDIILKLYDNKLPDSIDPVALIDTIQKQLPNGTLDTVTNIAKNTNPTQLVSSLAPVITNIVGA